MAPFADRLIEKIVAKDSRCIVGLDPRVDHMPAFVRGNGTYAAITAFHELVIDAVADLVPAVKPQLAFFEQYGVVGMQAFENTVLAAKQRGLLVIADGKRNDISSTAEAYANAYLGSIGVVAKPRSIVMLSPSRRIWGAIASSRLSKHARHTARACSLF